MESSEPVRTSVLPDIIMFPFLSTPQLMYSLYQIQALRISKNTPVLSPSKNKMASGIPRPLSEISPMEKRRNSPSWNQTTKVSR
jgi:hypothetical protein